MNIALLIIDVQKAYIDDKKGTTLYDTNFEYINETAKLFRENGKPIIVVRDLEGGDGAEYKNVDELITEKSDREVIKYYSNSFWKTDLENILKELNIDFVVLCGNAAEYCVLATYNGALERDFGAAMLQNGIFAATPTGLNDIAFNRAVVSYQVLEYMFEK